MDPKAVFSGPPRTRRRMGLGSVGMAAPTKVAH